MAKLDLEWLQVFVEIYRTRGVSRAAERLNIGQPNASTALKKLRLYFGDPLFKPTSRGMEPTPRAASIYPDLVEALARLGRARDDPGAFCPSATPREFRICMTDISESVLLPTLVNHVRRTAPRVSIEAVGISGKTRRGLEAGELDLAVGFMPDLEAGFYQQALFAQDFVCLASSKHPRVRGKIDRRTFCGEGHVLVTTTATGHAVVEKVLAREGIERRIVLRVPSFLGVPQIVAHTELLVLVPRMLGDVLASHADVQVLRPPLPLPSYKVKQHWHERFNADAGNRWLRQTLAELFSGHSPVKRMAGA